MTKEEILAKSRTENKNGDEMEKKVLSDAMKFSYIAMISSAAVFAMVRSEQGYPMMDLPAICCASAFANFMYRYVKTKEKSNLMVAAIALVIAIISTIRFFMGH